MIWSSEEELTKTCERVRERCRSLDPNGDIEKDIASLSQKEEPFEPLPSIAVGAEEDAEDHKDDDVKIEPYIPSPKPCIRPKTGSVINPNPGTAEVVTTDEDRDDDRDDYTKNKNDVVVLDTSDDSDDEIEVIAVVGGN